MSFSMFILPSPFKLYSQSVDCEIGFFPSFFCEFIFCYLLWHFHATLCLASSLSNQPVFPSTFWGLFSMQHTKLGFACLPMHKSKCGIRCKRPITKQKPAWLMLCHLIHNQGTYFTTTNFGAKYTYSNMVFTTICCAVCLQLYVQNTYILHKATCSRVARMINISPILSLFSSL